MKNQYELGCYGDGCFGHAHTRARCASLCEEVLANSGGPQRAMRAVIAALRSDMSDDAWEEDWACDFLNVDAGVDGASWAWRDGDFGLWAHESEGES